MTGVMFITRIIVPTCAILGGMFFLIRETQQPGDCYLDFRLGCSLRFVWSLT
jgi:hypothetical protein